MAVATIMCGGSRTPSFVCELVVGPRILTGRGRPRGVLNRPRDVIRREREAKGPGPTRRCLCGSTFQPQRLASYHCSRTCKDRSRPGRSGKPGKYKPAPRETRQCECGATFETYVSSPRQHCGARACVWRDAGTKEYVCCICGTSFLSRQWKASVCSRVECRSEIGRRVAAAARETKPRKWASRRDAWRHANHMRRAATAGSEKFSASEIYDRDRWRCGLCRKRVDRRLKWPNPMSVSLDHIVPICDGGPHSRVNVQCAHLSCNSRKSAGAGGQLRLFG